MSVTHTEFWFVWVDALKGPAPQIWNDVAIHQVKNHTVLQKNVLTAEESTLYAANALSLDQLAKKYPYAQEG